MKTVITMLLLVCIAGCGTTMSIDPITSQPQFTPSQDTEIILQKIDNFAESIPVMTEAVETTLETPAGKLVPEPIKNILSLIGFGLVSLSTLYLNARKNMFKRGMTELAYSNKILIEAKPETKSDVLAAEASALNPPTLKLLAKEGLKL